MTNQSPTPSGPVLNPTGIWVSGFLIGLLVGLVPWAISQFLPRGDRSDAEQQSLNVINPITPAPQQEGFNIPQNQTPPTTATPVPTSSLSETGSETVTQAPSTIPSQPSTSQPSTSQPSTSQPSTSQPSTSQPSTTQTSTNVNVSTRPIPARW